METVDEALNAKLIACWQAALNTDDPEESQRWVDMAEWLSHRGDTPEPPPNPLSGRHRTSEERRRFPRVPVCSPALLSLEGRVLRGETINLSRTGACVAFTDQPDLGEGERGSFTVQGWVEDRVALVVAVEPGMLRLRFAQD
jgi:hypothetical protein